MGTESDENVVRDNDRGIIPRVVQAIFGKKDEMALEADVLVECSMLEVYTYT